jgi:hypothetical protein
MRWHTGYFGAFVMAATGSWTRKALPQTAHRLLALSVMSPWSICSGWISSMI